MDGIGYYPYSRLHVFQADLKSGKVDQITKGPYDVASPSWAPNGKQISYVANPENGDYTRMRDVYVLTLGGESRKVTQSNSLISSVAWSPDGRHLAYTGRKPEDIDHPPYANTDIFVIPV
jgi:Tol biopolymer transport system component